MSEECIFCKIVAGSVPSTKVAETDNVLAFESIKPVASTHLLVIPKEHIAEFVKLEDNHSHIWIDMYKVAKDLIKARELETKGYRLVMNGGGANEVEHLHLHLIGPVSRQKDL